VQSTLNATIEQITVQKTITLPPGESVVKLSPAEFTQLNLQRPRLWWPNGYGSPELYHLTLTLQDGAGVQTLRIFDSVFVRSAMSSAC
jgi:hypothetical protein